MRQWYDTSVGNSDFHNNQLKSSEDMQFCISLPLLSWFTRINHIIRGDIHDAHWHIPLYSIISIPFLSKPNIGSSTDIWYCRGIIALEGWLIVKGRKFHLCCIRKWKIWKSSLRFMGIIDQRADLLVRITILIWSSPGKSWSCQVHDSHVRFQAKLFKF
jgi:hypothetical protein